MPGETRIARKALEMPSRWPPVGRTSTMKPRGLLLSLSQEGCNGNLRLRFPSFTVASTPRDDDIAWIDGQRDPVSGFCGCWRSRPEPAAM